MAQWRGQIVSAEFENDNTKSSIIADLELDETPIRLFEPKIIIRVKLVFLEGATKKLNDAKSLRHDGLEGELIEIIIR